MEFGGVQADFQARGDDFVGQSFRHQLQDFDFAWGEVFAGELAYTGTRGGRGEAGFFRFREIHQAQG